MRMLLTFVCMGFLGMLATTLAIIQVLARAWPALVIVLAVVVAMRLRDVRVHRAAAPVTVLPPQRTATSPLLTTARQPIPARPAGWVLVPVWMDAHGHASHHHPVIDGDVIEGDTHRG